MLVRNEATVLDMEVQQEDYDVYCTFNNSSIAPLAHDRCLRLNALLCA